jgi:2-octaprenyl-6-methoxyphenol hydroxylase
MLVAEPSLGADRPIALAHGSRLLLERVDAFKDLPATPITSIHVSQRNGFGRTLIQARDYHMPALGYVVSYRSLVEALKGRRAQAPFAARVVGWDEAEDGVDVRCRGAQGEERPAVRTSLLALADGAPHAAGAQRRRDYSQSAVVAQVKTEQAHANRAWERFTADGPLALLPHGDGYAVIWSTSPDKARELCAVREAEFLRRLSLEFGARLGTFHEVGPRESFPLVLRYAATMPGERVLAIGNAAQTLHPVAGQGLNLGLRDAWELAELLCATPLQEHGAARLGRRFARRRGLDRQGGIALTDALVRLFSTADPLLSAARGAALAALDLLPPARRFLAHRMMYGARALP